MKSALIVVDVQNDFLPEVDPTKSPKLPIPKGDKVVPVVNKLIQVFRANKEPIFFSRDFHPRKHPSFRTYGEHCVQNSYGAMFPSNLDVQPSDLILSKGDDPREDSLSAFGAHDGIWYLHSFLQDRDVTDIYVAGLALDYCVGETCKDGVKWGYHVHLVTDGTKPLKVQTGTATKKTLKELGVHFETSKQVIQTLGYQVPT